MGTKGRASGVIKNCCTESCAYKNTLVLAGTLSSVIVQDPFSWRAWGGFFILLGWGLGFRRFSEDALKCHSIIDGLDKTREKWNILLA